MSRFGILNLRYPEEDNYRGLMAPFTNATFAYPIPEPVLAAFDAVWAGLGQPGEWWCGAERIEIAGVARRAKSRGLGERVPTLAELDSAPDPVSAPPSLKAAKIFGLPLTSR